MKPGGLLCRWLAILGFMVMGLVSALSLASRSDSGSFLVVHALLSQDGCQRGGSWEVVRHVASPFDLSPTLPVTGGLLVACSSLGPPVLKLLTQMVMVVPGRGAQFQPECSPNNFMMMVMMKVIAQSPVLTLHKIHLCIQ